MYTRVAVDLFNDRGMTGLNEDDVLLPPQKLMDEKRGPGIDITMSNIVKISPFAIVPHNCLAGGVWKTTAVAQYFKS